MAAPMNLQARQGKSAVAAILPLFIGRSYLCVTFMILVSLENAKKIPMWLHDYLKD